MLWHHNARVNSHQRWKQTRFRICFHLWCESTSTMRCNGMTSAMEFIQSALRWARAFKKGAEIEICMKMHLCLSKDWKQFSNHHEVIWRHMPCNCNLKQLWVKMLNIWKLKDFIPMPQSFTYCQWLSDSNGYTSFQVVFSLPTPNEENTISIGPSVYIFLSFSNCLFFSNFLKLNNNFLLP